MSKKAKSSAGGVGIRINTDVVVTVADKVSKINQDMESDFLSLAQNISKLSASWNGAAASKAIPEFNKIKSQFSGENGRKAIMNQYVQFLRQAVATDYEATETTNQNLSELFK